MGYIYSGRKLCCDYCGKPGGVRKIRCPFGWCPATAMCAECKKEHKAETTATWHETHGGCGTRSAAYRKVEEKRVALLAAGEFLRVAAYGPNGAVEVTFRNAGGTERIVTMPADVYRAFSLLEPATVGDFERVGVSMGFEMTSSETAGFVIATKAV